MDDETFPGKESFVVDVEPRAGSTEDGEVSNGRKGVVVVVGKAEFKSKETRKRWKEQFIYRLSDFDE